MTFGTPRELAEDPRLLYRVTVDEYHRMIESGAIEEGAPFELLGGQIIRKLRNASGEDPMTVGTRHATVLSVLGDLNPKLRRLGCFVRIQSPLTLPPYDEPEPDGAIVRGNIASYREHHPFADDVLCVIEVADASLRRDRGYKQELYANSNIAAYFIVNLVDNVVEVYSQPMCAMGRYGRSETLPREPGQFASFPAGSGKQLKVPVRRLLP